MKSLARLAVYAKYPSGAEVELDQFDDREIPVTFEGYASRWLRTFVKVEDESFAGYHFAGTVKDIQSGVTVHLRKLTDAQS